jgi:uncharacterized membrane protein YebE (DUF533 family)
MKLAREEMLGIAGVLVHTMDLDRRASQDETVFVDRYLDRIGVPEGDREAVVAEARGHEDVDDHVRRIQSRQARIYALQQALLLALADGEYKRVERRGLKALAERLGIDDVLFEDLERWATEGAAWQIRGAALLAR